MKIQNAPLSGRSLTHFNELRSKFSDQQQSIVERIDYILVTVFAALGVKLENWYVDGAEEGEVGAIDTIMHGDYIYVDSMCYKTSGRLQQKNCKAIIDGKEISLLERLPQMWLFTNFEAELKIGIENYKNKLHEQTRYATAKREFNKLKKSQLVESARNKLTIDEQKAVGIYKKSK